MSNAFALQQSLSAAMAKLEDLRRKADDAMIAVARQRIEVEKIRGDLEKVRPHVTSSRNDSTGS